MSIHSTCITTGRERMSSSTVTTGLTPRPTDGMVRQLLAIGTCATSLFTHPDIRFIGSTDGRPPSCQAPRMAARHPPHPVRPGVGEP